MLKRSSFGTKNLHHLLLASLFQVSPCPAHGNHHGQGTPLALILWAGAFFFWAVSLSQTTQWTLRCALYGETSAIQGKLLRSVVCPAGCWVSSGAFHCARCSMQCDAVISRGRVQYNPEDANCTLFTTGEVSNLLPCNILATHKS